MNDVMSFGIHRLWKKYYADLLISKYKKTEKILDKKVEESMVKLKQVMSVLHKSTQKKIMHLNKASRTISKLQKDISAISK